MSDLAPVPTTALANLRADRRNSREVADIRRRFDRHQAERTAHVDAVEAVTHSALIATAGLTALEQLLGREVPGAENRLRHVADGGCMALSNIVVRMSK